MNRANFGNRLKSLFELFWKIILTESWHTVRHLFNYNLQLQLCIKYVTIAVLNYTCASAGKTTHCVNCSASWRTWRIKDRTSIRVSGAPDAWARRARTTCVVSWSAYTRNEFWILLLGMRKMCRFSSSCTCANYYRAFGLHSYILQYPIIHSVSGQWRPWSGCVDAQAGLGLCCPHMPEDTFSHGATHFIIHNLSI